MQQTKFYRGWVNSHLLTSFQVTCGKTDLMILAESNLQKQANIYAANHYATIEKYINRNPVFEKSLVPLPADDNAPPIIRSMIEASQATGVGPMASVAGAIAEYTGKDLLLHTTEVIVENGGDIFLKTSRRRTIAIYAGNSPLSGKIGITVQGKESLKGICTSSGTFGHSLSFGKADAAIAISHSAVLADAAATAIGNVVMTTSDINTGLEAARSITGIDGALIIIGSQMGAWGDIELTNLDKDK